MSSNAEEKYEVLSTREKPIDLKSSTLILAHRKGMRNQILIVCGILCYCMTSAITIGYSVVLLPQLFKNDSDIPIDMEMGSWIASVPVLAAPCTSFIAGLMSDSFGRRNTVIFSVFPMVSSWCIMALANSYYILILGRIISGFSVGLVTGPVQVYISEITEPRLRAILTCTPCVMYYTGILLAYILGALYHWRVVSWLGAIFILMTIFPLCFIPESPSWLVRNNQVEKAFNALKILRGHETIAEEEVKNMQKRLTDERAASKTKENIFQLCSQRAAYKPLTIVTVFSCLQILTGNFILINYANDFIAAIGAKVDTNTAVIATAVARDFSGIIFCSIVTLLPVRKVIMASGISSGTTSLLISIFLYVHVDNKLSTVEGYVICSSLLIYILFNTPMLIIPAIITGELLPAKVRGRCAGIVFAIMNIALFGIIKLFPYMQKAFKLRGVFLVFTFANLACITLVHLFQPDTTTLTLDEIEDYFNGDNWLWSRRDKTYKQVKQADLPAEKP